jgi:hypothetical protein
MAGPVIQKPESSEEREYPWSGNMGIFRELLSMGRSRRLRVMPGGAGKRGTLFNWSGTKIVSSVKGILGFSSKVRNSIDFYPGFG